MITGGTGRFANATGSFDMTVEIKVLGFETYEWPAVWRVEGTVHY